MAAQANGKPKPPAAQTADAVLESLIQAVDRIGQIPGGLDGAIETIRKRVEAANVLTISAKAERAGIAGRVKSQTDKIAANKKQIDELAKPLTAARERLAALEKGVQDLSVQVKSSASKAVEAEGRLNGLNEKIQLLKQLNNKSEPEPEQKLKATPKPATAKREGLSTEQAQQTHWSFQPVTQPALPENHDANWATSPIDRFILSRLEKEGMTPSGRADKRTLIRRAYYDLIGLPPTAEEIASFEGDSSPDAFAQLVDRLLASPRYGERWGRHWLDVARYADTKGYVFQEERRYAYAYTYRDYVINAFNQDLPYDRFILEQIAADRLPQRGKDNLSLAAMGFLTVGRRFSNNIHDIIDDRIDVVTRGLQGLTVQCGRCHDHKYDPITMADYYSLYGIFANSIEPKDGPLLGKPAKTAAYTAYLEKLKQLESKVDEYLRTEHAALIKETRQRATAYLSAIAAGHDGKAAPGTEEFSIEGEEINRRILMRWHVFVSKFKTARDPVWTVWHRFAELPAAEFEKKAIEVVQALTEPGDETGVLNSAVVARLAESPPKSMAEVAQRFGALLKEADDRWQAALKAHADAASKTDQGQPAGPTALADEDWEQLRQVLYGKGSPADIALDQAPKLFGWAARRKFKNLQVEVDRFRANSPAAPPRAMVLQDKPKPHNTRIFSRGNPARKGDEVPRQYLTVLARADRQPVASGSGRLELAREIASPQNPLTARVMVNRVWAHHFGAGLVRTPSDFGVQGDPPTHPQLLNYLAWRFMHDGWSIKRLHRLMMLSSTYQQTSEDDPRFRERDPDNLWVWKMNRRRQDFESLRDSILAASGRLDTTAGGASIKILETPSPRRTVYGFIDRQNLPGLLRNFDFASPDATNPQRDYTTVPQQALYMMNSPFVVEQANQLIHREEVPGADKPAARVRALYRFVYGRDPISDEVSLALSFVELQKKAPVPVPPPVVWLYGFGEFDAKKNRLTSFHPLPHFSGSTWQGGAKLPDEKLGWVFLNETGGHPGAAPGYAAVRRWVAPRDGTVTIEGKIVHPSEKGNGVIARIVTDQAGQIAHWQVRHGQVDGKVERLKVKQGETVDFVIECNTDVSFDSFQWAPMVRMVEPSEAVAGKMQWNAKVEFGGAVSKLPPPLDPWAQFAQVLLMSNEFVFVD